MCGVVQAPPALLMTTPPITPRPRAATLSGNGITMGKQLQPRALERDGNDLITVAEARAWCEANGLMPRIKEGAKRKPRNSKEQAALIARVMKRERPA